MRTVSNCAIGIFLHGFSSFFVLRSEFRGFLLGFERNRLGGDLLALVEFVGAGVLGVLFTLEKINVVMN